MAFQILPKPTPFASICFELKPKVTGIGRDPAVPEKHTAQQELRPPGIGRIDDGPKSATAPRCNEESPTDLLLSAGCCLLRRICEGRKVAEPCDSGCINVPTETFGES